MEKKNRERLIVGVAAILLLAAFSAVAYLDRSHGTVGDDFGQDDFTVEMERNEGHLTIPDFPSDLLIFGAGHEASLDFTVTNSDADNDIDTVYITIPDGEVVNATTEWYDNLFTHDWEFNATSEEVAKISAVDDLPGRVFGGSAQYDVAGNIDDALDYDETLSISEGITITLEFIVPSETGVRVGANAIDLEVADEMTEGSDASSKYSMDPFPYPFLVIDVDFEFLLYELEGSNADLDIEWDGTSLFGSGSRASEFTSSEHGYKYTSDNGNTVAVLNSPPEGTIVNPVITPTDDAGGQFTLDMVQFKTATIDPEAPSSTWVTVEASQEDYTGDLPTTAGEAVPLDIDGDGLFTDNDGDIDGDGIINEEDTDPNDPGVTNHHPTISPLVPSATSIAKNKDLTITASAADADSDAMTYAWSVSPYTGWTGTGSEVVVDLGDFEPGTYTFTVLVSDGNGGTVQSSTTIEVTEADESSGPPVWVIILIILVILVIVGAVVFYVIRGGEGAEDEIPEELAPQPPESFEDPMGDPGYDSPFQTGDLEEEDDMYDDTVVDESVMDESYENDMDAAPPGDIVPLPEDPEMQEVNDLESLIDEMERTEEEIGDVCPECSAPLGPYDAECGNCGAKFELALECPSCGAVVEEDVDACPGCGVGFN